MCSSDLRRTRRVTSHPARNWRRPRTRSRDAEIDPGVPQDRGHRDPRIAWPQTRRAGREFLAVPPVRFRGAGARHRLAAFGARRPPLCTRTRVGSRAHHLAVARSFAIHDLHLQVRPREQARPRPRRGFCLGRNPGRGRRAGRPSGPDAPHRQSRGDRANGRSDHPRSLRTCEPTAWLCAGRAFGNRGAVGLVESH